MNPTAVKVFWGNVSVLFVLLGAVVCLFIAAGGKDFNPAQWVAFYVLIALVTGLVFCLFTSNSKGEYTNKKLGISLGGGAGIGACFMVLAKYLTPEEAAAEETLFMRRGDLLALNDLQEAFDDCLSKLSAEGKRFLGNTRLAFVTLSKGGTWTTPDEGQGFLSQPKKSQPSDFDEMKKLVFEDQRYKDLRKGDEGEYWLAPPALKTALASAEGVKRVMKLCEKMEEPVRIVAMGRVVSAMSELPPCVKESLVKDTEYGATLKGKELEAEKAEKDVVLSLVEGKTTSAPEANPPAPVAAALQGQPVRNLTWSQAAGTTASKAVYTADLGRGQKAYATAGPQAKKPLNEVLKEAPLEELIRDKKVHVFYRSPASKQAIPVTGEKPLRKPLVFPPTKK